MNFSQTQVSESGANLEIVDQKGMRFKSVRAVTSERFLLLTFLRSRNEGFFLLLPLRRGRSGGGFNDKFHAKAYFNLLIRH
ncbi:hypothetical protein CKQ54_05280 [Rahnella variigena]|uniref:Uncharacterized protein n=1 Tax=Rahnella variigena TaxID=574964 RepID=A0ABX9PS00_9GAMM|nr:hypothetical protein D6D38_10425 [Rahnella variigena]RKF67823.1 hypothetical protein CKQ54_05280 [Rahnella variigena]